MKVVRTVFGWAVEHDWLPKSPMRKIPNGSFVNRDKDRFITMEEYAKLLEACPHQEWRSLLALARIGGLRCPSELIHLRWSDVHWAENRFLVRSPKTEHHEGHRERIVPLFPELRSELEKHFSQVDTKENELVISRVRITNKNLHSPFQTIARRAGLGTIIRPFDNMRMTRSTEVERKFGSKKESLWIGHSERVMIKHYLRLDDNDYAEAAGIILEGQKSHAKSHALSTTKEGKIE
jgi:integrase